MSKGDALSLTSSLAAITPAIKQHEYVGQRHLIVVDYTLCCIIDRAEGSDAGAPPPGGVLPLVGGGREGRLDELCCQ